MKKQSNLSRLLGYAGKHKILTYLSWISVCGERSACTGAVLVYMADYTRCAGGGSGFLSGGKYYRLRLAGGIVCGTLGCCLYRGSDVFAFKRLPYCVQYPQRTDAPYNRTAPWDIRKVWKRQTAQDCKYFRQRGRNLSCPQAAR